MAGFARFSFLYFIFAIVATTVIYGFTVDHLPMILFFGLDMVRYLGAGPWVMWLAPVLLFFVWKHPSRVREALYALIATIALICGYTLIKIAFPAVIPFWADDLMARADLVLHGGTPPWEIAHRFSDYINTDGAARTYSGFWGAFAFSFPAFLALSESDHGRKMRFLALYAIAWIGLGNGLAAVFSSVGPIYADRLNGGAEFAPMIASLSELTFPGTSVDTLQKNLWSALEAQDSLGQGGAGISAFPSMHVAISVVWAVYICERSKLFAPVGIAFAGTILFLSVYTGWHYAVDGYMSVIGVTAIYAALRQFYRPKTLESAQNRPAEIDPTLA